MNQIKQFINPKNTAFWGCCVLVFAVLATGVLMAVNALWLKGEPYASTRERIAAEPLESQEEEENRQAHTLIKPEEQPFTFTSPKETDEWVLNNRHQILMPYKEGYCFNTYGLMTEFSATTTEIFSYGIGDGKYKELLKPVIFVGNASINGVIYGIYEENASETSYSLAKYENDKLTVFKKAEFPNTWYYAKDYIYFTTATDNDSTIYRMDYNGEQVSKVLTPEISAAGGLEIMNIAVYNQKLWYEYGDYNPFDEKYEGTLASYDFETNETTEFEGCGLSFLNNGYVYYTKSNSGSNDLYRLNIETHKIEKVFENCGAYSSSSVAFADDYILYIKEEEAQGKDADPISELYMINGEENKKILSGKDIGQYIYLSEVQVLNGKIFVTGGEGAFYSFCAEIDINGKVLRTIY
ncbi:MAG: DUF5050 domain-containing protein [Oscillospiraceae bacterium]|nr:DUF5050 domain-containing protein [Oscillospiraceae bacterium]